MEIVVRDAEEHFGFAAGIDRPEFHRFAAQMHVRHERDDLEIFQQAHA